MVMSLTRLGSRLTGRKISIFLLAQNLLDPPVHCLFRLKRRRSHPLTWLSSHKLGRPVGLAVRQSRTETHEPPMTTSPTTPAPDRPRIRKVAPVPMVWASPLVPDFFSLSHEQQWEAHLDAGRIGSQ